MRPLVVGCIALVAVACGGSDSGTTSPPVIATPTTMTPAVDVTPQVLLGKPVTISVRLSSAAATPVGHVTVAFTPANGAALTAVSDTSGIATVSWTPIALGSGTITASVAGTLLSYTFAPIVSASVVGTWKGSAGSSVIQFSLSTTSTSLPYIYQGEGVIQNQNGTTTNINFLGTATGSQVAMGFGFSGTLQVPPTTMVGQYGANTVTFIKQ
jgi:hypothetical protein